MTTRVRGGVFNNQSVAGKLTYYKITGVDFSSYASLGAYEIQNFTYGLDALAAPTPHIVAAGQPIPKSAAELVYLAISDKATMVTFEVTSSGEIHIALENTNNGWNAADMQAALRLLGPNQNGTNVGLDDPTENQTYPGLNLSAVVVTEAIFELV